MDPADAPQGEVTTRPPLFELHDARVRRAGKVILAVDDFSLGEGESVALIGPNGAGKSTFVQLLTREVLPLHREEPPVRFRSDPRPTLADIRRSLGVVSATMHDQVRVHLSVGEVVVGGLHGSLGLPMHREVTRGDWENARDALGRLGIAELVDRDVMTLSDGQVRRTLIARELVRDPAVLVFDEPCSGLDPEGMYHVREAMATLADEGRSIVLVTHYAEDIIPAMDRVLLLGGGRVVADGPKGTVLTDDSMTGLFGVPLAVEERQGWYHLRGLHRP